MSEKYHSQNTRVPSLGISTFEISANISDKGVNEKMRKKLNKLSTQTTGLYIASVNPLSSAGICDIKGGDILCEIDGFAIETEEQYNRYLCSLRPFDWVTLRIKRGKKIMNKKVELIF